MFDLVTSMSFQVVVNFEDSVVTTASLPYRPNAIYLNSSRKRLARHGDSKHYSGIGNLVYCIIC